MEDQVEEVYLRPWEEMIGVCTAVMQNGANTTLVIESKQRIKKWKVHLYGYTKEVNNLIGQPIAILRTESAKYPFLIRKVTAPTAIEPTASAANDTSTHMHNILSKKEANNEQRKG